MEDLVLDEKPPKIKDDWIVDDDNASEPRLTRQDSKKQLRKRSPKGKISRKARVTLKDLIDTNILSAGDLLSFSFRGGTDTSAILLQDGQIQWSGTIYKSLSTFVKKVANSLGLRANSALYNGWRVVSCRGKVMDEYRAQYQNFPEIKKEGVPILENDIDDEEDNNSDNDDIDDELLDEDNKPNMENLKLDSASVNNLLEEDDEEEDEIDDSDNNNKSPSIRDSFDFGIPRGSEGGSPQKEESVDSVDSMRDSLSDSVNDSGYENSDMGEVIKSTKRLRKERVRVDIKTEKFNHESEQGNHEEACEGPVYYFDDVFFNVCSVSNVGEADADEQDVLIIGHPNQTYLDIRDKDFFNVTSDDAGNVHFARTMSQFEDSYLLHPFSTVEDFYSSGIGIDTEYF